MSKTVLIERESSLISPSMDLLPLVSTKTLAPSLYKKEAERSPTGTVPFVRINPHIPLCGKVRREESREESPKTVKDIFKAKVEGSSMDPRNVLSSAEEMKESEEGHEVISQTIMARHAVMDLELSSPPPGRKKRGLPPHLAGTFLRKLAETLPKIPPNLAFIFFNFAGYDRNGNETWVAAEGAFVDEDGNQATWNGSIMNDEGEPPIAGLGELPANVASDASMAYAKINEESLTRFLHGQSPNKFLTPMSLKVKDGNRPLFLILGYTTPSLGGTLLQPDGYFDCRATIMAWNKRREEDAPVFSFSCPAMDKAPYEGTAEGSKCSVASAVDDLFGVRQTFFQMLEEGFVPTTEEAPGETGTDG